MHTVTTSQTVDKSLDYLDLFFLICKMRIIVVPNAKALSVGKWCFTQLELSKWQFKENKYYSTAA